MGGNTYNKSILLNAEHNEGQVIYKIDIDTLKYEGRKVYKEYKEPIAIAYFVISIND